MSEISDQIINELLDDKLSRHPVWVWYDPREKYRGIIDGVADTLQGEGVNLARYDGSYLELKAKLWEQDPDINDLWVFYIPESQSDADWFTDIHKLGKMYRPTVDVSDEPAASYLVERTDKIPDEYSEWGTDPEQLEKAFFTVLFGQNHYSPRDFLLEFFNRPGYYIDLIKRYEQEDNWHMILLNEYGIEEAMDPIEIARGILFAEVEAGSSTERYSEIAAEETTRAAEFCTYWQRNATKTYLEYATDLEDDYDLESTVVDSESLGWEADAFLGIDEGLLQLCLKRFESVPELDFPAEVPTLQNVVERRMDCFWYEDGHADYWDVLDDGLRVIKQAAEAKETIESGAHSTEELTERYTDQWWEIDAAYRNYIQSAGSLLQAIDGLDSARKVVTGFYTRFLRALNRDLAESIQADPTLGPPQTNFWDQYVDTNPGTAIIVCDALRYELAQELENQLEELDAEVSLDHVSAAFPSITEVGMAAHLPGQLGLDISGNDLTVTVDDETMNGKGDRVSVLETEGFNVGDMSDIATKPTSDLQDADLPPLVLYSGVIDKLGENLDNDEQALAKATDHIKEVERVVRKLKTAGYTRFVITADHGFLYTERLPDELNNKLSADPEVLKRRFAATKGLPIDDPSVITFEPTDLREMGIESNGVSLSFPRSVACLTAPGGNMRYFHGGISVQELLVPCVTIIGEADESIEQQFDVAVSFPTAVTNNIVSVGIEPEGQMSIATEKTIIIRATADDREVCEPTEVTVGHGTSSEQLRLKTGQLDAANSVLFEAIDGETREVLESQRAKLDMVIRDDGFDI